MMNEKLGYIHFWITFVGVYLVFFPMHYIGIAGFPRRYYSWTNFETFSGFADLNMLVSAAAIMTLAVQIVLFSCSILSTAFSVVNWLLLIHGARMHWNGQLQGAQDTVIGLVRFQRYIVGLMITVNPVQKMILSL